MTARELLERYYSMLEELQEREKELVSLRRKKLSIQERLSEIKEKNRQQIIKRLEKEIDDKKKYVVETQEKLKGKKATKLELEKEIREIERKLQ